MNVCFLLGDGAKCKETDMQRNIPNNTRETDPNPKGGRVTSPNKVVIQQWIFTKLWVTH